MSNPSLGEPVLFMLLERLRSTKIHYRLGEVRDDYVLVSVAVPGERWEIEVSRTGEVEVERFRSDGDVRGAVAINDLFDNFSN